MKRIKYFKLFENLESRLDLELLSEIIIDLRHMGLEYDIKVGSSSVLDFNKLNKEREFGEISPISGISIHSGDIDIYRKGTTNNSLTIELFKESQISEINFENFKDAYDMVTDFLQNEYQLQPNYIYINYHWNYQYFENTKMLEMEMIGGNLGNETAHFNKGFFRGKYKGNSFKAHKIILAYYIK